MPRKKQDKSIAREIEKKGTSPGPGRYEPNLADNYKYVSKSTLPPIDESKLKLKSNSTNQEQDKYFLKPAFLESLKKYRTIYGACLATNVDREVASQWIKSDPEFKKYVKAIISETREVLFQTAFARSMDRTDKGSTALLIFLMKTQGFSESQRVSVDIRVAYEVVLQVVNVMKKLPNSCPHCSNRLDMKKDIAEELMHLSKKFEKQEMSVINAMAGDSEDA